MDTRQFHKRCFALLLACALALGCLPRAQAASRSAIESLQSQQASLTVQKAELQKKLDGIRSSQGQALNKKNLVEQQLNVLNQQIQVSENLLAQYARQITEKEAELEQAKAKEAEYRQSLSSGCGPWRSGATCPTGLSCSKPAIFRTCWTGST